MGALLEYGSLQLKDPVTVNRGKGSLSTRMEGFDDDARSSKNLKVESRSLDQQGTLTLKMDEVGDDNGECKDKTGRQDCGIDLTVDTPYITATTSSSSSTAVVENVTTSSSMGSNAGQSRIGMSALKRKRKSQEIDRESAEEGSGEEEYNEKGLETGAEDQLDNQKEGEELTSTGEGTWSESVELERRRLRCLIELGHFDSVVDQSLGLIRRVPELESALIPLGIEASWKLMKWGDLDGFLHRIDTPSASDLSSHTRSYFNSSSVSPSLTSLLGNSRSHEHSLLKVSILPEDRFQVE